MGPFPIAKRYPYFIAWMLVFVGLYLASLYSYLLFHSLAEIFSIVVACGIFMVTWNSRRFLDNNYLLFLGIAYLFVGGLDLIHTLAYRGMGIFQGYGTNLATQLWIAARYVESLSLLVAPLFIRRKLRINVLFLTYTFALFLILLSIFYWNIFPVCFVEDVGLTPFKKISEYIISLTLLASIILLLKNRTEFDRDVLRRVVWSIILTVASELAFTFYLDAYGLSNLLGHFLKIVSFYLIYKALIEMGLTRPYDLLFRNLKQGERMVREEKNKIQNYLDIAGVILVAIDANQNVTLINKKGCEILGFEEKEIIGKNWFDTFIPEGIREDVKAEFRKLMKGEVQPIEYFENPVLTKTREERMIAWHNAILRDEKGEVVSTLSSGEDITERKRAEQESELLRNEAENEKRRLEAVMEALPVGVALSDIQGGNIRANKTYEQIWGTPRPAAASVADYAAYNAWWSETGRPVAPEEWASAQVVEKGEAVVGQLLEIQRFDGTRASVINSGAPIFDAEGKIAGCAVAIQDITEMRKAEEALRNSEERLRLMIETSPVAIGFGNSTGKIFEANESFYRLTGYTREEIQASQIGWDQLTAPEYAELDRQIMVTLAATGSAGPYEKEYIHKNGSRVPLLLSVSKLPGRDEHIAFIVDITERKQAEQERERLLGETRAERDRLLALVASMQDEVWFADTQQRFTLANPAALKEFRLTTDGTVDIEKLASGLAVLRPDGSPRPIEESPPLLALKGEVVTKQEEIIRTPASGELRYRQVSAAPVRDKAGRIIGSVSVVRDITERKQAEEAIRKSKERFELLSETASRLLATDKPQEVVNDLCLKVMTHLDCHVFFNYLVDQEKQRLHLNAYAGIPEETGKEIEWLDYGVAVCGCAARDVSRIVCENIPETQDVRTELIKSFGIKAYACHPLLSAGRVIGTLSFGTRSRTTFSEEELSLMKNVADQVAIAMERMKLIEALRRSRDELEIRVQERTKEVREQSRILDSFFKFSITPFVILDKDFNFIRVNEAYAKACQREVSEFPGHNHFEFYPSDAKANFEQVVRTKEPYVAVARPFSFPDHPEWGTTYWNWTLTPILGDVGETEFLVFSLEDVTERKHAEQAVKTERQRFYDLLEMLPAYLVLLTPDYHVPFANRFFRERFGESEGKRCFEYLFGRTEPCEIYETYTVLKTGAPHRWEWTGPDGRIYDVSDFPFTDTDGSTLILEMGIDITERKRAEHALSAAHQYTRSLIEASLDPLVTISPDGEVTDVNTATELATGVSREQLIGSDFSGYFTEPQKAREGYQTAFMKGTVRDYPLAIRHTSGMITDVLYNATIYRNETGAIQGVFAVARDVTERKRAEEALKESEARLRDLSSRLLTTQESERKRVALELHDGIGQMLTAIKFKVENTLQKRGKGATKAKEKSLEAIIPLVKETIEEVRRMQMDLRPSTLDDLGVLATLGWFCREYQKIYSQIRIEKEIAVQEGEVPEPLKVVLYRLTQEAMNNVAKHSQADLVHLSLRKKENRIEWAIEDNGMGFDAEKILSSEGLKRGLGLSSMRERTELSGGMFAVESTLGRGTILRARWTLP